jgi:hypothetical protein
MEEAQEIAGAANDAWAAVIDARLAVAREQSRGEPDQ